MAKTTWTEKTMKNTRNMLLVVAFSFSSQFVQQDQPSSHCWEFAGIDVVE